MAESRINPFAATRQSCPACGRNVFVGHNGRWREHSMRVAGQKWQCVNSSRDIRESFGPPQLSR
jgi:hypothetical protein